MFLTLVATFAAGFAGAGAVMLLRRFLGRWLPGWLVPASAGAAMLATAIGTEYAWYPNTVETLPDGMVVVQTVEESAAWRPWTLAYPYVERFVALDADAVRINENDAALRLVDLYLYGRWAPIRAVQVAVDCDQGRRADPSDEGIGAWREVGADDPVVAAACAA